MTLPCGFYDIKVQFNKLKFFFHNFHFFVHKKIRKPNLTFLGQTLVIKCGEKQIPKCNKKNTICSVKHGGGNVMLWDCMSANSVGNMQFITDKMDHQQHIQILKDNLKAIANKLGLSGCYIFQQDNDPKYTAHNTKLWILYNTK